MKYKYHITLTDYNGNKRFTFCLPEGLETLTRFLNTDVGDENTAKIFIETCRKVQSGESEVEILSGNVCVATFKPDFVDIEDMFFDKKVISIETWELIKLIETFLQEKRKYIQQLKE